MTDYELDALLVEARHWKGPLLRRENGEYYGLADTLADAIAALREQVAAKDAEIARLLHLINMDFDCLPTCDKFGHDPECPYCNGEPKLRILAERAERAEADNAALRKKVSTVDAFIAGWNAAIDAAMREGKG